MAMIGLSSKGYKDMVDTVVKGSLNGMSSEERDNNIISILEAEEIHKEDRIKVVRNLDSEEETFIGEEGIVIGKYTIQSMSLYCIRLDCGETILSEREEIVKVR